ncbi:MAG: hypothetical protein U0271_33425 [Polyangiaceae bacterium]
MPLELPRTLVDLPSVLLAKSGPILFTLWKPTKIESRHVREAFEAMFTTVNPDRKRGSEGSPTPRWVLFVTVPKGATLPDDETRNVIKGHMQRLQGSLVCGATVIEEPGLTGVAQRAVVSTLQLLSRPNHPEKTVSNVDDAAEFIVTQWRRAKRESEFTVSEIVSAYQRLRTQASAA